MIFIKCFNNSIWLSGPNKTSERPSYLFSLPNYEYFQCMYVCITRNSFSSELKAIMLNSKFILLKLLLISQTLWNNFSFCTFGSDKTSNLVSCCQIIHKNVIKHAILWSYTGFVVGMFLLIRTMKYKIMLDP